MRREKGICIENEDWKLGQRSGLKQDGIEKEVVCVCGCVWVCGCVGVWVRTSIRNIKLITVIMQNLTGNKQLKLRCSIWKGKQLGMGARVLFSWLCGFIQKSPLDTCFYFHALTHRREQDSNQKEKLFRICPPCINAS